MLRAAAAWDWRSLCFGKAWFKDVSGLKCKQRQPGQPPKKKDHMVLNCTLGPGRPLWFKKDLLLNRLKNDEPGETQAASDTEAGWETLASPQLHSRILRVAALVDGPLLAKMLQDGGWWGVFLVVGVFFLLG